MRVIQATPKDKTKILSQKRKTPNDSKGKSSQKAKKKRLLTSSDSESDEWYTRVTKGTQRKGTRGQGKGLPFKK